MQRWQPDRRQLGWIVGGCAALLVLCGVLWVAPNFVLTRVKTRAAERGFLFEASDTELGFDGVEFEGVSVRSLRDQRVVGRVEHLEVELNWLSLSEGSRAVAALAMEGGTLDLSLEELRRREGGSSDATEPAESGSKPRVLPEIKLVGLDLTLRDAAGPLLSAKGLHVQLAGERFQVGSSELTVGSAPGEVIAVREAAASGQAAGRRPVLASASSKAATLTWAAESGEARPGDPFPPTRGRTLARLRALRDALRPERSSGPSAASSSGAALWSDDAKIELENIRVLTTEEDGGTAPILEGLKVGFQAQGSEALRATGSGNAPNGGRVGWDLRVEPKERRMEGRLSLDGVPLALLSPVLPPLPFEQLERTQVRASLNLRAEGLTAMAFSGDVSVQDLAFASEGLAKTPVGPFSFAGQCEGVFTPEKRELSGLKAKFSAGKAAMSLTGALAWPTDGYRVDVLAELPKTRCQDVLAAVPAGLLDELSTVELSGTIGGKLTAHVDAADLDATKVDFDIKDDCKFGMLPPLLDLGRFQRPFLHQVLEPDGTLFEMETGPGSGAWTPIEHISPFLVQAVVAHEDGRFFGHRGFAEPEIAVALSRNLKAKAFRFGASTITMQLVKNVFLHREKLLARKIQEAFIVWWLEQHWDKRQIMELYLNVIEYGPAIYGIRNAALHYFGTIPMNLTPAQAAFFASILPSPKSAIVHYEKKTLSQSAKNRVASLLKHMHSRQRIDDEALAYGLEELTNFRFYDPAGPPPVPPQIRGHAQPPPFHVVDPVVEAWDALPFGMPTETGAFGSP